MFYIFTELPTDQNESSKYPCHEAGTIYHRRYMLRRLLLSHAGHLEKVRQRDHHARSKVHRWWWVDQVSTMFYSMQKPGISKKRNSRYWRRFCESNFYNGENVIILFNTYYLNVTVLVNHWCFIDGDICCRSNFLCVVQFVYPKYHGGSQRPSR